MRYVDEFRDPGLIRGLLGEIRQLARDQPAFRVMEVCGGHTHSIFRFGLQDLLPGNVELIHGPGCPVCVLPRSRIDQGLSLAAEHHAIFTAFGDMMRVPGTRGSPLDWQARGAEVRMVYSPLDALELACRHPDREVLFFAIGFETTAPATALTIRRAREQAVPNFSVFCNHVLVIPALEAVLEAPAVALDGFIGPGHVSTVIGCQPFEVVSRRYHLPLVTAGFEPLDILQALAMVLRQIRAGEARVENQYTRAVAWEGNRAARQVLAEVFTVRPQFEWRGLGSIPASALRISDAFAAWDAERKFSAPGVVELETAEPEGARCGDVLRGAIQPPQCPWFGQECVPEHPLGALMVSAEGACAAHFKYRPRAKPPSTSGT